MGLMKCVSLLKAQSLVLPAQCLEQQEFSISCEFVWASVSFVYWGALHTFFTFTVLLAGEQVHYHCSVMDRSSSVWLLKGQTAFFFIFWGFPEDVTLSVNILTVRTCLSLSSHISSVPHPCHCFLCVLSQVGNRYEWALRGHSFNSVTSFRKALE